jgi:tRNA(Ile)-lysidine synthase
MLLGTRPTAPSAISATQFNGFMQALGPENGTWPAGTKMGVAVSGGPDSMALTMLLHEWTKANGTEIHALIVDHQLRADSRREAEKTASTLKAADIRASVLTWRHHTLPQSAVHVRARAARYELMFNACRENGIRHLFLAHHADDQGETVLIRFARGSALDGLSAMPSIREQDGMLLVRPLLPVKKERLIATCKERGWEYIIDPSNASPHFTRGRLRDAQDILKKEGLTPERLYEFARTTGMVRAHLEGLTNSFFEASGTQDAFGVIRFGYGAWAAQTPEMQARILTRALLCASGEDYAPRSESLDRMVRHMHAHDARDLTLSGCLVQKSDDTVTVMREENMAQDIQALRDPSQYTRWDKRFVLRFTAEAAAEGLHVRKLGNISRAKLEEKGHDTVAAVPASVRASLPALYKDQDFAGIPAFFSEWPDGAWDTNLNAGNHGVAACFLPRRSLIVKPFQPCPPMAD